MSLGKNLIAARDALGWSQAKLADECGVTASTIGMVEQRDSKKSDITGPIAKRLGISADVLTHGTEADVRAAIATRKSKPANQAAEQPGTYDARQPWPFRVITPEQWGTMNHDDKVIVEGLITTLLGQRDAARKSA